MVYNKLHSVLLFILVLTFSCSSSDTADSIKDTENGQVIEIDLTSVNSPFEEVKIPLQNVSISAEKDTVLVFKSGSFIDIPENAFLDKNGDVVEGQVDFSFREFTIQIIRLISYGGILII